MKRTGPLTSLLAVATVSLFVTGCAGEDPVPGPEWDMDTASVGLHLSAVGSCADVEAAVREAAIQSMKRTLYAQMMDWLENGAERCEYADDFFAGEGSGDGGDMASGEGDGGEPSSDGGPSESSETNNQVSGVDEADFLKNDEDGFIYMLSGGGLHVVDAWPADETNLIGSIPIEGEPKKMVLKGNRAVVFSALPMADQGGGGEGYDDYGYGYGGGECTYGYDCQVRGDGHPTKLTVIDLSDRTNPVVVRELRANGSLIAARRIDGVVHTVLALSGPQFPISFSAGVSCEGNDAPDAEDVIEGYSRLLHENTAIIEQTPIATVLPSLVDSASGADALASCPATFQGRVTAGVGFTTLTSFDMDATAAPTASTVVSDPGVVYASESSLYVAVPQSQDDGYGWYSGYEQTPQLSAVHRFALGTDGASSYVASGAVKGKVLNQFSMDEHEGHLRIATTSGQVPDPDVHSTLSVLAQSGADLQIVGAVDDIAPTEDIRSVRFSGDRGFVVTFKKTDPLFVFDLAEPTAPRILSELKIPGFSTYMHMMDDTHLLTIGFDADDHGDFAYFDGVLLQIFDVSDPLAPTLAHKEVIGTRGSSSEALTNHLAFNYFGAKNLLALPMTICEGGDDGSYGEQLTFSGLMVYDVTVADGFALRGKLDFATEEQPADPYGGGAASCSSWWSQASSVVRRSVIMDDFVYGITDSRIQVSALEQVSQALASVDLPEMTQP